MEITTLDQTKQGEPGALPEEPCSQRGPVGSSRAELHFILFAPLSTFSMDAKGFQVSELFTLYSSLKSNFSFKLRMAEFCSPENSCDYIVTCLPRSAASSVAALEHRLPVPGVTRKRSRAQFSRVQLIKTSPLMGVLGFPRELSEFGHPKQSHEVSTGWQ